VTTTAILATVGLGVFAGLLGGLAGVGGSMIMLPGLHMIYGDEPSSVHHLYMAAAMTVNVAVALPAALRHRAAKAVRVDLLPALLISTLIAMVVGVFVSNAISGDVLRYLLAAFIFAYCLLNLRRLLTDHQEHAAHARTTINRLLISGAVTGFVGGLLGLGGGVLLVPFLQILCRVPLRQSIATSSAVVCITAVVGAGLKLATLHEHHQSWTWALAIAAMMAPTAIAASLVGAGLTHSLPIKTVRTVITVLLMFVAVRLVI
jgi:uncharacterized membrane protein YfcA